jgi:hypothetical protein
MPPSRFPTSLSRGSRLTNFWAPLCGDTRRGKSAYLVHLRTKVRGQLGSSQRLHLIFSRVLRLIQCFVRTLDYRKKPALRGQLNELHDILAARPNQRCEGKRWEAGAGSDNYSRGCSVTSYLPVVMLDDPGPFESLETQEAVLGRRGSGPRLSGEASTHRQCQWLIA